MQPNNESTVYHMAETLAANLRNHNIINAYPMLQPVLHILGIDLLNVFSQMLGSQRQELFYGESPWAKLYEIQTGKKIEVPDKTILKNLTHDRSITSGSRPMSAILDYFLKYRTYEDDEFVFHNHENNDQVTVDLKTRKAKFWWANNDMTLELTKFDESRGHLNCPLFNEPYDVDMDYAALNRLLLDQMYEFMLDKGQYFVEVEAKYLLMQHYFGSVAEPIRVADDSNVRQLMVLLDGGMYSKWNRSYATINWKEWVLQFSVERDWNYAPPMVFKVVIQTHPTDKDRGQPQSVYNWHKNPLLVKDLLSDMDGLLDQLITQHELSMKEQ